MRECSNGNAEREVVRRKFGKKKWDLGSRTEKDNEISYKYNM